MSNVMEFDVDGRYLMGFMGSGKGSSFMTQLGPVVSRKIISRVASNMKITSNEDPDSNGKVSFVTRKICNDDWKNARDLSFSYSKGTNNYVIA